MIIWTVLYSDTYLTAPVGKIIFLKSEDKYLSLVPHKENDEA